MKSLIICSTDFVYSISPYGKIYLFAKLNKESNEYECIEVNGAENVSMISCGEHHTVYLNENGEVYSFGSNDYCQLGIYGIRSTNIPQKIDTIPTCIQISCGEDFTFCLTQDHLLYCFGNHQFILYGDCNRIINEPHKPRLMINIDKIKYITGGSDFCICETLDGKYISFGSNTRGQLGNGDSGYYGKGYVNFPPNIIDIKCGDSFTLLQTKEGYIYSFGANCSGQLGISDKKGYSIRIPTLIKNIPQIKRIECGYNHSLLIDISDFLWVFGRNNNYQLGFNSGETKVAYLTTGIFQSTYIKSYKDVINPRLHPDLKNVMDISSGGNCSFVKTMDKKIYAFGNDMYEKFNIKPRNNGDISHIITPDIWHSIATKSKQKSARK